MACCHPVSSCRIDYDHNTRSRLSQPRLSTVVTPPWKDASPTAGSILSYCFQIQYWRKKVIAQSTDRRSPAVTRRPGVRRLNIEKRTRHPRRPGGWVGAGLPGRFRWSTNQGLISRPASGARGLAAAVDQHLRPSSAAGPASELYEFQPLPFPAAKPSPRPTRHSAPQDSAS